MSTTGAAAAAAENNAYLQIFDYLSAPLQPSSWLELPTVVFGREDPLVARAFGDLVLANNVECAVITGGIGKDSGSILEQGFKSEAHYLASEVAKDAQARNYHLPKIFLDPKAKDGGQNARNSAKIFIANGVDTRVLTANAHATSLLRLSEVLQFETGEKTGTQPTVYRNPSAHKFDPTNPAHRVEAAKELLRLSDWPVKGWLGERRSDLPEDLVEFARTRHGDAPEKPSELKLAVLGLIPARQRIKLLKKLGGKA